jgi:hypothetical protein
LSVVEAAEIDIAAVFLDRRPDSCFEEFFDHLDDFAVVGVVCECVDFGSTLALLVALVGDCVDERLTGCQEFIDDGEDFWLDMCPWCGAVFGNGNVVETEEDGGYAVNVEELSGERGRMWWRKS